jgi:hypothetical protein
MVLCGICNDDYTKCDAQGGILVGSYAICPACSLEFDETEDEPIIRCPEGMQFRDWVLRIRGGRNTIEITTF